MSWTDERVKRLKENWADAVATPSIGWSRRRLNLSAPELATLLRVDRVTVWRWENGKAPVPHAVQLLLALWCDYPEALDRILEQADER